MFTEYKNIIVYILVFYLVYLLFEVFHFFYNHYKHKREVAEIIGIDKLVENSITKFLYKARNGIANNEEIIYSKPYESPSLYSVGQKVSIYFDSNVADNFSFDRLDEYWSKLFLYLFQIPILIIAILNNIQFNHIAFLGIFFISGLLGYKYFKISYTFKKNSLVRKGKIIDYLQVKNAENQLRFRALVEFSVNSNLYRYSSNQLVEESEKKIGYEIRVLCDKHFPEYAKDESFLGLWLPSIFFFTFSTASLIIFIVNIAY